MANKPPEKKINSKKNWSCPKCGRQQESPGMRFHPSRPGLLYEAIESICSSCGYSYGMYKPLDADG